MELNRWTFLLMQVFEARTFLDLAEGAHQVHPESSLSEVLTQQALFRSFLLSYGKCFVSSGTGRSSLDPHKVYASLLGKHDTHDRLLFLRHKFAAHSDASGLEDAVIEVVEKSDEFEISHLYSVANPVHEYSSYRELLSLLEEYIVAAINKHLDSLEKKLGKAIIVNKQIGEQVVTPNA
jgi:hypothetical protein